jgi:hypothetical protein
MSIMALMAWRLRGCLTACELDEPQVEQRMVAGFADQRALADARVLLFARQRQPVGAAAQRGFVVEAIERTGVAHGHQAVEPAAVVQLDLGGRPQQVDQVLRTRELEAAHRGQRQPRVARRREQFQHRADAHVAVAQPGELAAFDGLAVERLHGARIAAVDARERALQCGRGLPRGLAQGGGFIGAFGGNAAAAISCSTQSALPPRMAGARPPFQNSVRWRSPASAIEQVTLAGVNVGSSLVASLSWSSARCHSPRSARKWHRARRRLAFWGLARICRCTHSVCSATERSPSTANPSPMKLPH